MGGAAYRRLPPASRRAGGRSGGVRVRAWVLLRRVAVRLHAARRSWAGRCGAGARRLTWATLCGRGASAAVAVVAPRRSAAAAAAGAGSYDSASYARNFDDGVWKAEEGVFWSTGSFACRFAHRAATASPPASGNDPTPSSSI